MDKELAAFADFVAGELLDMYQMKEWGCDFEEFKRQACECIEKILSRYTIEDED